VSDERALRELELLEVARWFPPAVIPASAADVASSPVVIERVAQAGWEDLRSLVTDCRACGLCQARKQAVFGVGHESAPWLFVGEGPGADEDEKGEPFVGQAGKLLDSEVVRCTSRTW
jgi:DNA polymerase